NSGRVQRQKNNGYDNRGDKAPDHPFPAVRHRTYPFTFPAGTLPPMHAGWNCVPLSQGIHEPERGILAMQSTQPSWHGTTILTVRKGGLVAVGGDGQVS